MRSLILAGVVVACAPDLAHESRTSRSIATDVIVTVENRASRPSLIYLQFGGRSHSLGEVPRRSTPWTVDRVGSSVTMRSRTRDAKAAIDPAVA